MTNLVKLFVTNKSNYFYFVLTTPFFNFNNRLFVLKNIILNF